MAARLAAVDGALRRLLGPAVDSPEIAEAAELARTAAEACTIPARPLYAGHRELDWPAEPHLILWHAITLLREFRGDGHLAALQVAGLDGLPALIVHTATGKGFLTDFAKTSRGWSDEQWDAAAADLREQDIIGQDGLLTESGAVMRGEIEVTTDRLALAPWQHLGQEKALRLAEIGSALTKQVGAAGAFPEGVFRPRK